MSTADPHRQPTSQLAWAALICGLMVCMPLLGLMAILLGALSLGRISASGGKLGGRRMALLAMGLGGASTVIWALGLDQFQTWYLDEMDQRMETSLVELLNASSEGEAEGVRTLFANGGSELSDEEFAVFAATLQSDWGPLASVAILRSTPQGAALTPRMAVAFEAEFQRQTLSGTAMFALQSTVGSMLHEPRLLIVELSLPDGGTARLASGYDVASTQEEGLPQ